MSFKIKIVDENLNKTVDAFDSLVDYEVKTNLLAQVVRSELMNLRSGNAHTKTRAEVSGGGKKPWKQKGTGRARHGSTRSPIWVGGGVNFGPRNTVNWHCKINKSSRITAIKSILKDRLSEDSVYQFSDTFEYLKTKNAVETLSNLREKLNTKDKQTIILYSNEDKSKVIGFNSTEAQMMNVGNMKIINLVNARNWILTPKAKQILEEKITK